MKRYGLGLARPAPVNNDALIEAGYLHKADSLARLAQQLGLDAQAVSYTHLDVYKRQQSGRWGRLLDLGSPAIRYWYDVNRY